MIITDGSLDIARSDACSRLIMRNDMGQYIVAGCNLQPGVVDFFISELLACKKGLEEANHSAMRTFISRWTVGRGRSS
jgi:hypothetical protein